MGKRRRLIVCKNGEDGYVRVILKGGVYNPSFFSRFIEQPGAYENRVSSGRTQRMRVGSLIVCIREIPLSL